MDKLRHILLLYFLLTAAGSWAAIDYSAQNGFSASAGGEYQYISQEFYTAALDTAGLDIIETWRLDQDEINELILKTNLGYLHRSSTDWFNLFADFQVSNDRLLGRSEGFYQLGTYDNYLKMFGRFEAKSPFDDGQNRDKGYNYIQAYFGGKKTLFPKVSVDFKTAVEIVTFTEELLPSSDDTLDSFRAYPNYDYRIFTGQVGGRFEISEFTREITWLGQFSHRVVPDSGAADYDLFRVFGEYSSVGLKSIFRLESELEFKNYAQPRGKDDYLNIGITARFNRYLTEKFEAGLGLSADIYTYHETDVVNRDNHLIRAELKGAYEVNMLRSGPLWRYEFRGEAEAEDDTPEYYLDIYRQWEVGAQGEVLGGDGIYISGEATYGYRDYNAEQGLLSSYHFWSLSCIGNYYMSRLISIDLFFDGLFERHELKEENSNVIFLSIGITARI